MLSNHNHAHKLNAVAVHMALLKTGKAILFSGAHEHIWNWNKGESSLWDPQNPDVRKDPTLKRNLFCSGHCFLPDGRLLVAGGQSTFNHPVTIVLSFLGILQPFVKAADHDIHTFDPDTEEWKLHTKMPRARWYPTCVTLPDGKALILSGTYSHAHHAVFENYFMNLDYEIFDPETNTLSEPQKFIKKIKMYPFLQVLPGGTLFVHSQDTTSLWKIADKDFIPKEFHTTSRSTRTYPGMGSCVLLPITPNDDTAKILVVGGSTSLSPNKNTPATDVAEIFEVDLNNPADSPGWREVSSRHTRRFLCDSILLPDGKVLVTNGAAKGVADHNDIAVSEIELFDPCSETWTVIGSLQKNRLYHSSAILLPDGQVLVAGSTGHVWITLWDFIMNTTHKDFEQDIEIITPPYLSGNPTRREIGNVQPSISYNTSFEVTTSDAQNIQTVALIRPSSTTHNDNMDQRYLVLSITDRTNNTLKLSSPKDGTYAPPGYYMLFLLDNNNVPSIGKFVKVG